MLKSQNVQYNYYSYHKKFSKRRNDLKKNVIIYPVLIYAYLYIISLLRRLVLKLAYFAPTFPIIRKKPKLFFSPDATFGVKTSTQKKWVVFYFENYHYFDWSLLMLRNILPVNKVRDYFSCPYL